MTAHAEESQGVLDRLTRPLTSSDDPRWTLMFSLAIFGAGYALVRYREAIGDMTGYYIRGMYLSTRTPGCLLVPFGVLLMVVGAIGFALSLYAIVFGCPGVQVTCSPPSPGRFLRRSSRETAPGGCDSFPCLAAWSMP